MACSDDILSQKLQKLPLRKPDETTIGLFDRCIRIYQITSFFDLDDSSDLFWFLSTVRNWIRYALVRPLLKNPITSSSEVAQELHDVTAENEIRSTLNPIPLTVIFVKFKARLFFITNYIKSLRQNIRHSICLELFMHFNYYKLVVVIPF